MVHDVEDVAGDVADDEERHNGQQGDAGFARTPSGGLNTGIVNISCNRLISRRQQTIPL